jgi:malonyl CoA-acyl carrier protein transacylase/acyl carrier protein
MTTLADRLARLDPEQRELLLRRLAAGAAARPADDLRPRPDLRPIADTAVAQEELWLLDQLDPGSPCSNIGYPVRLRGPLDVGLLERALAEVVRRHEALRTTFPAMDGRPVQRIAPTGAVGMEVQDLSGVPAHAREEEARRRVMEARRHRFALDRGPLLRVTLLRLGPDEHMMVLVTHHIVSDGWSLDVLFRELAALYGAFSHGLPSPLPDLPIQYADWAAWQNEHFRGARLDEMVGWWRDQLAGAPTVLELRDDRPVPWDPMQRGGWHRFRLPSSVVDGLRALAREESATPFAAVLTVFKALLCRWTGKGDLVVGSVVANRTRVEAEALIGYFVNSIVLRTRLEGDPSFRQALQRVRDTVSGAFAHQELPFDVMVEALRPEVRVGFPPIFQVQFFWQNATGELRLPGIEAELVPTDGSVSEFDLSLNATEHADGSIACGFEYSADLLDAATVERLGQVLEALARAAVAAPDLPLSRLPLPELAPATTGPGERSAHPAASIAAAPADAAEWRLLVLSARTPDALEAETAALAAHVRAHPEQALGEVARALAGGRRAFAHRRAVVVREGEDVAALLESRAPGRVMDGMADGSDAPVAFLFPGADDAHPGMAHGLHEEDPVFRGEVERCATLLRPHLGLDLRDVLYPTGDAAPRMDRAELAHPAAFVVGYALARVWAPWGIVPEVMLGHGAGELVAACVAGVLPLDGALELVAARGRAIDGLPGGSRLDVDLAPRDVEPFLVHGAGVEEASLPGACVVAGRHGAVDEVERRLRAAGHEPRRRPAAFAFRSPFTRLATHELLLPVIARISLAPPAIPLVSSATGGWLTDGEATHGLYWARHFRETVRFDEGISEILREPGRLLLEVGPGTAIRDLVARRRTDGAAAPTVIATLGCGDPALPQPARLLAALGRLWTEGASPGGRDPWAGARHRVRASIDPPLQPVPEDRPGAEAEAPFAPPATAGAGEEPWMGTPTSNGAPSPDRTVDGAAPQWSPGPVQERLAALWTELLGVEPRPSDDFFLLGGHSLLATQLTTRVRETFGVELEMRAVFAARSLAALASVIEAAADDEPEFLSQEEALALV